MKRKYIITIEIRDAKTDIGFTIKEEKMLDLSAMFHPNDLIKELPIKERSPKKKSNTLLKEYPCLNRLIDALDAPTRLKNICRNNNIKTIYDLAHIPVDNGTCKIRHFGKKVLEHANLVLNKYHLHVGMTDERIRHRLSEYGDLFKS